MDKSFTEAEERHLRHGTSSLRVFLALMVFCYLALFMIVYNETTPNTVYACSDGDKNPPDVIAQCKQLTKYQWWGHYYQGRNK